MAIPNGLSPRLQGVEFEPVTILADDSESNVNSVPPLAKVVVVADQVNDANDFIVLPPLNSCPNGHEITVIASAGGNFEVRTPAASAEEINSEDCDGTKELLVTDTTIVRFVKINNTIGWMSNAFTAIGAVQTAVVPD